MRDKGFVTFILIVALLCILTPIDLIQDVLRFVIWADAIAVREGVGAVALTAGRGLQWWRHLAGHRTMSERLLERQDAGPTIVRDHLSACSFHEWLPFLVSFMQPVARSGASRSPPYMLNQAGHSIETISLRRSLPVDSLVTQRGGRVRPHQSRFFMATSWTTSNRSFKSTGFSITWSTWP
jgi:hypothetical protein